MNHDEEKERKLLKSQKIWEEIFDKTNDIITIHDKDFNIIRANKAARRILGLKRGDIKTKCYKAYHGTESIPEDCPVHSAPVKKEAVFERYEPGLNRYFEFRIIPHRAGDCLSSGCIHIVRDITERKKSEEKLSSANELLENVFSSTNYLLAYLDSDFNIIRVNQAYADAGRKPRKFFVGKNHFDLYPHRENEEIFRMVVETGEPYAIQGKPFEHPDQPERGTTYWDWTLIPVKDVSGKVTNLVFSLHDVTGQIKAEEALKENEARFRELADLLPQPVCEIDKEGNFTYANQLGLKTFGFTQKDIDDGLNVLQIFAPEERNRVARNIKKRLKGEEFEGHEYIMMKNDGNTFPALLYTSAIVRNGMPVGVRGVLVDITYRIMAEEEIKKHSHILKEMAEGVNVADSSGIIKYANAAFERIFGYGKGELIGSNVSILNAVDDEENETTMSEMTETFNKNGFWRGEVRSRRKDGSVFYTLASISEIELSGERHWISVQEDITERIELEQSLRQSLNDKDILMKEIHHRVKNNMTVIQSLLSLQLHDVSDEKSRSYFKDAQNRVKSMSMIHERLSRSEELSKMDLSEFINSLSNHLFQSSGLNPSKVNLDVNIPEITIDVETMLPCGLIINELVSNAFKYAFPDDRAGVVTIGLLVEKDNEITLSVKDNGVGIPDDLNIYETKSLGLQIVSALTNQIQGDLELVKGNGTEIRITFKEKRFR
jgi:PAS domain S-box-containing protein